MDKDGYGSSGVWNIRSYIPLDYVVLSFYYCDHLQVGLCDVAYYCSVGVVGIWTKIRIYKVPLDPVIWSCQDFGCLCQPFMLIWIIGSNNDLKVYQKNHVNAPPNIKLAKSLMNFEFHPSGIFEGLLYHQEDEFIDPTIFSDTVWLGDRIRKLVS